MHKVYKNIKINSLFRNKNIAIKETLDKRSNDFFKYFYATDS